MFRSDWLAATQLPGVRVQLLSNTYWHRGRLIGKVQFNQLSLPILSDTLRQGFSTLSDVKDTQK